MRLCSNSKISPVQSAEPPFASAPAFQRALNRWLGDEAGTAAIEYCLIAAFICLAILAAIERVSGAISAVAGKLTATLAGM